jgi:type IV secretory pathway VirJ component
MIRSVTRAPRIAAAIVAIICCRAPAAAAQGRSLAPDDVRDLPLSELRAAGPSETLAIVLSGDGGWADIDREVGKTLASRGIDVVGFDDRAYLRSGKRDPDGTAFDVARVASHYMKLWGDRRLVLVGYSRGAAFAPFVATRLPAALKSRLALVAMLGLAEHASFRYHFSDLWATRTNPHDLPILPELEKLRGTNMMCVFGKKEDESLCREVDPTLVFPVAREGSHHFDGDYRSITDLIIARMPAAK